MLSMRDQIDSDMTFYIYATIEFIEAALKESGGKAKVLIHCYKVRNALLRNYPCFQGISRSAAILAGYLMWKKQISDTEALEVIREKRGFVDPNLGFVG